MAVVEEEAVENRACGRNIMVGVPMDDEGRGLLNWAIEELAGAGDRIVALHVYRKSDLCNTSILSVTKSLDAFVAECEDYCNAKQVAIEGRLAEGKCIKKVIIKEARLCDAAVVVVVGVNKNTVFRISAPLGKYCAKKLPPAVGLYEVHGGKIILERRPSSPHADLEKQSAAGQTWISTETANSAWPSEKKVYMHSNSLSLVKQKPEEQALGWPLLRRAATVGAEPSKSKLDRNMSVVQWAMSLPDRSHSSPGTEFSSSDMDQSPHGNETGIAYHAELHKELEMILENNSPGGCHCYTRAELEKWTCQFSSENLIGNGGSSKVYRGLQPPDGQEVAVKITRLSRETFRDFLLEADIITTLQHEHIIRLKGVSIDEDELMSVYDHFSRGSLEENLHGKKAKLPLDWSVRFEVALGIAEALSYIHNECPQPVIHRDVKSSNILLSGDFKPQLSDFGLAIWAPRNSSHIIQNDVVGTFGYLAPEYFMYGKVSDKVDVYSFGVVLLELLTGRKPISSESSKNEESLVMWATKTLLEKGDLMDLLDPKLEANYDEDQLSRMAVAATTCIRRVARLRPQMHEVLSLLRGEEDVDAWIKRRTSEEEADHQDEEAYPPPSSVATHLGVALQDVDDAESFSSTEPNYYNSVEEYLKGRWSRSSSFD